MTNDKTLAWLLEKDNPAVAYRTKTEILGEDAENADVKEWIFSKLPESWHEASGLWYSYYITALAECGMKFVEINPDHLQKAFDGLDSVFDSDCGDFMLLRALVKLGCGNNETFKRAIEKSGEHILPDGGFLCLHRIDKLKYTSKSCYKANLHALLFAAECKKNGIDCPFTNRLTEYFWNHNVFYRTDNKGALVLNARPGWRTIDTFYPFEVMRVGLQNVVEAFSALGYGNDERLKQACDMLNSHKDENGTVLLGGTLTKSYLQRNESESRAYGLPFIPCSRKKKNQMR